MEEKEELELSNGEIEILNFLHIDVLSKVIKKLVEAYEEKEFHILKKGPYKGVIIYEEKNDKKEVKLEIDNALLNYHNLENNYSSLEYVTLFAFGPETSNYKLEIEDSQLSEYIQQFANILYEYRKNKRIIGITEDEIFRLLENYIKETTVEKKEKITTQKIKK